MKRKVIWTAEAHIVPALKRVIEDGAVKTGGDISAAPPEILDQLIDQRLAAAQETPKKAAGK